MMMKAKLLMTIAFVLLTFGLAASQEKTTATEPSQLLGTWKLILTLPNGQETTLTLTIQQNDGTTKAFLRGDAESNSLENVVVSSGSFSASFSDTDESNQTVKGNITANLNGERLSGGLTYLTPRKGTLKFSGTRSSASEVVNLAKDSIDSQKVSTYIDKTQFEAVKPERVKLFPNRYDGKLLTFSGAIGEIKKADGTFFLTFRSEDRAYFYPYEFQEGFCFVVSEDMADMLLQHYESNVLHTPTTIYAANVWGKFASYTDRLNRTKYVFMTARIELLNFSGKMVRWVETPLSRYGTR